MKLRVKALLLAAGFACALNANATTYNLGSNFGVSSNGNISIDSSQIYNVGSGSFSDTFNFSLTRSANLQSSLTNLQNVGSGITLQLFNANTNALLGTTGSPGGLSFSSLAGGSYYFLVNGEGIGASPHRYTLHNVVSIAAVPEPESWAMMGVGLLFIMGAAYRKKWSTVVSSSAMSLAM